MICMGQEDRSWDLRAAPNAGSTTVGTLRGGTHVIVLAVADRSALSAMVAAGGRVGWLAGAALRKRVKLGSRTP